MTLSELVESIVVTSDVYNEALEVCKSAQSDQKLYMWNITSDSYDYVICHGADSVPEVVTSPYLKKFYFWNGGSIINSHPDIVINQESTK